MKNNEIIKIENIEKNNEFIIRWKVTSLCNYNCDFCIQGNKEKHIEKAKKENKKIRQNICNNLVKFIEENLNGKYQSLKIYLIGGEVTILNDFLDIFSKLVNCNFKGKMKINITTNVSFDKEMIKNIKKIIYSNTKYIRNLHISCSYYKKYTTEKKFVKKIKMLSNKNLIYKLFNKNKISVSIGYPIIDNDEFENYINFRNKYLKVCSSINYIIIRKKNVKLSKKNIENLKKIEKNVKSKYKKYKVIFKNGKSNYYLSMRAIGDEIKDYESFNPKGYKCDSGIYSFSIESNGDVFRCVFHDKSTFIGNIKENYNINLPKEMINCNAKSCSCSYFKKIEKI